MALTCSYKNDDLAVEEFLKSYEIVPLSLDGAVGIESESEYCLITLPGSVQLEMLNEAEISLNATDSNFKKSAIHLSNYDCAYEEMDKNQLSQVVLKSLTQNSSEETTVSSFSIKSQLKCTKMVSLNKEKQRFYHQPLVPAVPKTAKQRYVLFGSNFDIDIGLERKSDVYSDSNQDLKKDIPVQFENHKLDFPGK